MDRLSRDLVQRLDIQSALTRELTGRWGMLPEWPGLAEANANAREYAGYLASALRSGLRVSSAPIVYARKPAQGTRPLTVLGLDEEVAYSALTDLVLGGVAFDRSPATYVAFIKSPIDYARSMSDAQGWDVFGLSTDITHVVKTDIVAFYDYVDHAVLRNELLKLCTDFDAVEALIQLLGEIQGRAFGLPQMYLTSDQLSDIYIDILERDLLRQGLAVWRYNDDFRIACKGYSAVLDAIEMVGRAARDLGLVIAEHKTFTPKLSTYVFDILGVDVHESTNAEIDAGHVEAIVGEYSETEAQSAGDAVALVMSVKEEGSGEGDLNATELSHEDLRRLRRALWTLAREPVAEPLNRVVQLLIYAPSLTPEIIRYMIAAWEEFSDEVIAVVDTALAGVSLGSWQRHWMLYLIDTTRLLVALQGEHRRRVEWVRNIWREARESGLVASATLVLARGNLITSTDVEQYYRPSHKAWWPVYFSAFAALQSYGALLERTAVALRSESPLARWIIESPSSAA